jgi:PAS domain S-box-containing protein
MVIITPDGGFLDANRAFCDFLGYSRDVLLQLSVIDITHPDDREETRLRLNEARKGERQTFNRGKRYLRKDGATVWGQGTANWFFDGAGTPLHAVAIMQDITVYKQAEAALQRSEARYRAIVEAFDGMIYICSHDFRVEFMNERFIKRLGRDPTGEFCYEALHGRKSVCPKCVNTRVFNGETVHWETQSPKDNHWYYVVNTPISNPDGTTSKQAMTQDITERKHFEMMLRESEAKFAKAFHTAPSVFAITDLSDGRFIEVNEAFEKVFGYRREEVIGLTSPELNIWEHPEDRETMRRMMRQSGRVHNFEASFRNKAGRILAGLYSAEIIEIDGKEFLLSLMSDITARKRMEEKIEILNTDLACRAQELETANRELEAFNSTVSHDLRSPLTGISGFCQLLLDVHGDHLGGECTAYVREIYGAARRMDELITTLLDFSRLSRCEMVRETIDLSALAEGATTLLKMISPPRNVTFSIAEGMMAEGDARLLRVVLDNLFGNAWKYSAKRETALIEFGCDVRNDMPTFFVRDNGAGFAMADADKLFQPFQRLPGSADFAGHGIGLATVQRIIQRHDGRIWAEGEPDRGATFYFTLGRTVS